jgi:hypothetical protein
MATTKSAPVTGNRYVELPRKPSPTEEIRTTIPGQEHASTGSNETKTPGIAKSPSLLGPRVFIVSAISTSYVMFEPTVCFEAVQNRALLCPATACTDRNQLGKSLFHVLQRLKLSCDIGDLCLSTFSHAIAGIDRVHPQSEQFSDLFKRESQFLRMSDEPEAPDGIVGENTIPRERA